MLEKTVEAYLVERVRALGGTAYKFTSPARASVPDRIVILPPARIYFIEVKRPGGKLTRGQEREHEHLRRLGADVRVLDSIGAINAFLNEVETAPAVPAPEGWKLVPIEPTQEMLDCWWDGLPKGTAFLDCTPHGVYGAMLDAAPAAPAISESDVLVEQVTKDDWRAAFNERHEFDIYPDDFMTGLRNEFAAGWYAALKTAAQCQSKTSGEVGTNTGHGHVWDRPDGVRARCGGPMTCKQCAIDAARKGEKS
jgi:hypothetical protein